MKKSIKIADKQNENISRERESLSNPINEKMLKFGKSIRSKLGQKNQLLNNNRRISQPLQESGISNFNNRQSTLINEKKPFLQDISKMSVSYISQSQEDKQGKSMIMSCSRSNLSKTKSVRFSQIDETQSMSLSKSIRKSQSILKNSVSSDKLSSSSVNSHVGTISGSLSIKASVKDKGIDCQNKKYESTIKILTHQSKKFFDDMFPPGCASLFHSKSLSNTKNDIRWMRLEDIYRGYKQVLYSHSDRNIIKTGQFRQLDYMATCFNALGNSPRCLERIFENQQHSKFGIYYLRLNYQGIWKYIIVDDFIPVRQVGKTYQPVFMNICPTKSHYIQIWPLILQKALAKMYSTYECLFNQTVQNLMQQLTGVACQKINLVSEFAQSNELRIKSYLLNKNNIFIGSEPITDIAPYLSYKQYALSQTKKQIHTYFTQQTQFKVINIQKQRDHSYFLLQNFHIYFKSILIYKVEDSFYSVGCVIKQQKGTFSLRTFKVDSYGKCTLSVIQKDKKYYRNNGYQYCWMRIFLVAKDLDGYRYINSAYAKSKIVYIDSMLAPGQYFILINGDWNKKVYDITLNYQGNIQTQIKRQPFVKYPNIIDETCRDMAQRFGTFAQINKNVCSYQFCDKKNGLIIQNFNNQLDRQVYFHRNYRFPFKNFTNNGSARFIHQQVNHQASSQLFGLSNRKSKDYDIQTFLQADANLTMVVMVFGGLNEQQFSQFKFPNQ